MDKKVYCSTSILQGVRVDYDDTSVIIPPKCGTMSVIKAFDKSARSRIDILQDLNSNVIFVYRPIVRIWKSAHTMMTDLLVTNKLFGEKAPPYREFSDIREALRYAWGTNEEMPNDIHFRQQIRFDIMDIWNDNFKVMELNDVPFPFDLPHENKAKTGFKHPIHESLSANWFIPHNEFRDKQFEIDRFLGEKCEV